MSLTEIRKYLAFTAPGKLSDEQSSMVESLLSHCWEKFSGATDGGMAEYKLLGRTQEFCWAPPLLCFRIERHGAIVEGGSSRAEVQGWKVDLDAATASFGVVGFKQIRPMNSALDVKPIAARILASILNGVSDPQLIWQRPNRVTVVINQVIPANASKQTMIGRRKRFRKELELVLEPHGWQPCAKGTQCIFENTTADSIAYPR